MWGGIINLLGDEDFYVGPQKGRELSVVGFSCATVSPQDLSHKRQ